MYPTSAYPLVLKSLELHSYRGQSLVEPILELGTGDGYFTSRLCHDNGRKVIGTDMIGYTLLQARKYTCWSKLAVMDAMHAALPDSSVNTVIVNNLIHHLPSRHGAMSEIWRVLRPKGRVLFTDEFTSWATSQWQIKARGWNLGGFLRRNSQNLLDDDLFWDVYAESEGKWKMVRQKRFFSNRSMLLASPLETLNRKMGAPTPKPIRDVLDKWPWLRERQTTLTSRIAETLIAKDAEWCDRYGATSVFLVMEKVGGGGSVNEPELVCPACHGELGGSRSGHNLRCTVCGEEYPILSGFLPILLPYHKELPGWTREDVDGRLLPEVSC